MLSQKTQIKTLVHTGPLLLLAKQNKKRSNNNTSTNKRERLWCGEKRKHSQFKTHGVSLATCWPSDVRYVTVVRLAAKYTNQPSQLQITLKSLAPIKPHNFLFCSFFLIIIIVILPWIESESVTFKASETSNSRWHYLWPMWSDRPMRRWQRVCR